MKSSVLTRYRVMAYVTAVTLLIFSVFIVLDHGFDVGSDLVVSQVHGVLYFIYVIFAFDLGQKVKWSFGKILWVLVAGCIPTAAFFVERRVTREITPLLHSGDAAPMTADV